MKKIEKILLPVDFGPVAENAYHYALMFADELGAKLDLIHCAYLTHPSTVAFDGYPLSYEAETIALNEQRMEEFVSEGLDKTLEVLKNAPQVSSSLGLGDLPSLIKTEVTKNDYDLVIMGTNGAHNFWRKFLGSNSSEVLYNAPCPVLIIPDQAKYKAIEKLCYTTDLDHVDALASNELLEVLKPFHPAVDFIYVDDKPGRSHAMDMDFLRELVSRRIPEYATAFHILEDKDVSQSIIDFANMEGSDIIIMPRPHYNFVSFLFHKSYTREVAHETNLPLLVLNSDKKAFA